MKKLKPILLIFFILIIYIYVCCVCLVPSSIIVFQGEKLNINTIFGITISQKDKANNIYTALQTSTNSSEEKTNETGTMNISLDLFGTIPLKEIDVNILPRTKVIPLGKNIGLRLYTEGVLVVGMSEIKGQDNKKYKPYENTGIKEGDTIIAVDNKEINDTDDLIECVNQSKGRQMQVKYMKKDEKIITTSITPAKISDTEYKLGLWVRDAAEGVGTATFYEPSTGKIAVLGHPITDVDTGNIINISKGEVVTSKIVSIVKGERGKPGEIQGRIGSGQKIGEIIKNTAFGIYGIINQKSNIDISQSEEMEVALRSEIKQGKAYILCELESGKTEKYEIEIEKIYSSNNYDNKSMLIKVTDERLLEKTGGIIQGMSGSPIIQNEKFVGAVTHVLVSDPTQGYAVFGDLMIKQMREVK